MSNELTKEEKKILQPLHNYQACAQQAAWLMSETIRLQAEVDRLNAIIAARPDQE